MIDNGANQDRLSGLKHLYMISKFKSGARFPPSAFLDHFTLKRPSHVSVTLICSILFFWPKMLKTSDRHKHYFQQDEAPAHTSNIDQDCATLKFGRSSSMKCVAGSVTRLKSMSLFFYQLIVSYFFGFYFPNGLNLFFC